MFATGKGTLLDTQNIVNRFFKSLLKRPDLPDVRWHDLSHTVRQEFIGDSSPSVRLIPKERRK